MKTMRVRYLIHGIVETGEVRRSDCTDVLKTREAFYRQVLERSVSLSRCGSTEPLGGDWSFEVKASLPGGRLAVRLYAPGMDPAGPCASSMSVTYEPGKPPVLWASRASIHLAPDPWKAATEVRDLELGLTWTWIPLVEAWIDQDWTRTLAALEECREHDGVAIDDEEEEPNELYAWELGFDDPGPWGGGDSPWDWAPVDVREDWGIEEREV